MKTRKKSDVDEIIIHCFGSKFGTEKLCYQWHRTRNFFDIGYHFVILNGKLDSKITLSFLDGEISPGRSLIFTGAHCRGNNDNSIGVALVGDKEFTKHQIDALVYLCDEMDKYYGRKLKISNHYDYNKNKTCPNFDAAKKVRDARRFSTLKPINQSPLDMLEARVTLLEQGR